MNGYGINQYLLTTFNLWKDWTYSLSESNE